MENFVSNREMKKDVVNNLCISDALSARLMQNLSYVCRPRMCATENRSFELLQFIGFLSECRSIQQWKRPRGKRKIRMPRNIFYKS